MPRYSRKRAKSICFCLGVAGRLRASATVTDRWIVPDALQDRFRALKINVEVARTGSAVSTYNILLGEGRRVAAGLIAVG